MSTITRDIERRTSLIISPRERLSVWEKARGMWQHRKPEPIKEWRKMRREWERKLPRF